MAKLYIPKIGIACPSLSNENYKYHLSGDATAFCICSMNNLQCVGITIVDPEDRSTQFFSRGKCMIDPDLLKACPMYGCSAETFKSVLRDKMQKEINEKLNKIK
jgi:hypothetical protein